MGAQYSVTALNVDGTTAWTIASPGAGGHRVWADVAVGNVDNTGGLEVVVAWSGGFVGVFDLATGAPLPSFNGGAGEPHSRAPVVSATSHRPHQC